MEVCDGGARFGGERTCRLDQEENEGVLLDDSVGVVAVKGGDAARSGDAVEGGVGGGAAGGEAAGDACDVFERVAVSNEVAIGLGGGAAFASRAVAEGGGGVEGSDGLEFP